jgi:hypothetical protein
MSFFATALAVNASLGIKYSAGGSAFNLAAFCAGVFTVDEQADNTRATDEHIKSASRREAAVSLILVNKSGEYINSGCSNFVKHSVLWEPMLVLCPR